MIAVMPVEDDPEHNDLLKSEHDKYHADEKSAPHCQWPQSR